MDSFEQGVWQFVGEVIITFLWLLAFVIGALDLLALARLAEGV